MAVPGDLQGGSRPATLITLTDKSQMCMANSATVPAGQLASLVYTCEAIIRSGDCPAVGVVDDLQTTLRAAHDAPTPEQTTRLVEDAVTEYLTQTTTTERHTTLADLTTELRTLCEDTPGLANYTDSF